MHFEFKDIVHENSAYVCMVLPNHFWTLQPLVDILQYCQGEYNKLQSLYTAKSEKVCLPWEKISISHIITIFSMEVQMYKRDVAKEEQDRKQ